MRRLTRHLHLWLACELAWAGGLHARADDVLPAPLPVGRYQKMGAHSPFAPPTVTVVAPPAPVVPGGAWADKLSLKLLFQEGSEYVATIYDKDTEERLRVSSNSPDDNNRHLTLASVQWADKSADTRVTIRRGAETAQIHFESDPNAPGPGQPQPPVPGPRPQLPGGQPFHPPPGSNNGPGGPNSPSQIVRRPPIATTLPHPQLPGRPNTPVVPAHPAPDDDDDDN